MGERKAIRQRIVLSNTNALEVSGLQDWSADNCVDEATVGHVVGLSGSVVDGLRATGSFKACQGWGLFRRPACLVRRTSLEVARACGGAEREAETVRRLVVGARGAGKSVWLLQAQAVAFMMGWVVIHIPEGTSIEPPPSLSSHPYDDDNPKTNTRSTIARDMTNATTAYTPLPGTKPPQYSQPDYGAALLSRIARANEPVLSSLTLTLDHSNLPLPLQPDTTLHRLAELGAQDPTTSHRVFQALWAELTTPNTSTKGSKRPPIMLTLDGLAHASRQSAYLRPDMHHIHAHDLALLGHFMAYLSGAKGLPNGGAVIAADSLSNRPVTRTVDLAVRQSEERSAAMLPPPGLDDSEDHDGQTSMTKEQPLYDPASPYTRIDERVLKALRGVPVVRLAGFSKDEARAVLEYYARSGMLRARVTDGLVGERWALSGGGVVGELERATVGAGVL